MRNDLETLLAQCREIAAETEAAHRAATVIVPYIRRTGVDVAHAHTLAEYTQRPTDAAFHDHPVTIFPIGQMPPL